MQFFSGFKYGVTSALLGLTLAMGVAANAEAAVSEGVATVTGTWSFDFETGSLTNFFTDPGADVWWEQMTSTTRQLVPENGASLAYVGVIGSGGLSFNDLTVADLAALTYTTAALSGSDGSNVLTPNTVFAVKTTDGNYAKVLVTFPFFQAYQNNGLGVYYVTLTSPTVVAEPETYGMLFAGLGMIGAIVRRRWS
jgi:hypothetical protein